MALLGLLRIASISRLISNSIVWKICKSRKNLPETIVSKLMNHLCVIYISKYSQGKFGQFVQQQKCSWRVSSNGKFTEYFELPFVIFINIIPCWNITIHLCKDL